MVAKRKVTASGQESLGKALARLRKQRGLTQVELAEKLGISQPNISHYESDAFRPNSDTLLQISQALGVSVDSLLGQSSKTETPPMLSRKLLKRMVAIERLPKRDQQALLRTIDAFLSKSA